MKPKIIFSMGIILVLISTIGCQSSALNASNSLSKPETTSMVDSATEPAEILDTNCSTIDPHPVAQGMTETFEITYDAVMNLYCDGYAFSDILLALETAELVDQSPETLLARLRTRTWQEIWTEYGVNPK